MPYIKMEDREKFNDMIDSIASRVNSRGDLNYIITRLIHKYLKNTVINYDNLNACIGVLECAKLELYRVIAAPYENVKIIENGTVGVIEGQAKPEKNE